MREQQEEAERRQHQAGGKLHVHHWILRQEHGVTRSCHWTQLRSLGCCGKPVNEEKVKQRDLLSDSQEIRDIERKTG